MWIDRFRSLLFVLILFTAGSAQGAPVNATAGGGQFELRPAKVQSKQARQQARELYATGGLQAIVEAMNLIFVLPVTIGLRVAECEEANAYYDSEAREISMCLELIDAMTATLADQYDNEEDANDALAGAYLAVVLHEAGHALVDVLELPITGREEDAVDQLSAWLLIQADDVDSVLGAAASYYSDAEDPEEDDYAGEHSLDRQRYFNLLCWAYGSAPGDSDDLIQDWGLPAARAERCPEEYSKLDRSWSRLLRGHLRPEHEIASAETRLAPSKPPRSLPSVGEAVYRGN